MFARVFPLKFRNISLLSRVWNGPQKSLAGKESEEKMVQILRKKFPKAQLIEVSDISGGCGAMFEIHVVTSEFEQMSTVNQHRAVNNALQKQIENMHGLRIFTSAPK